MKPPDSAWLRRGFERRTRLRIFKETLQANYPHRIPELICQQNPSVSLAAASDAYRAWRQAAGSPDEGTATYGKRRFLFPL